MSDEEDEIERAAVEELLQQAKKAEEASLPLKPPSIVNKRLYCSSLASTLRNPILPKAIKKRRHVGLDEPDFDKEETKRPNAGREYDPDGDYIYDARRYFNPEKYREIVANQVEKERLQQKQAEQKFYYQPLNDHRRRSCRSYESYEPAYMCPPENNYTDDGIDELCSSESPLPVHSSRYHTNNLQSDENYTSRCRKKLKKKSKNAHRHRSHASESSRKHVKRKKKDHHKKHRKKHKRKKSNDRHSQTVDRTLRWSSISHGGQSVKLHRKSSSRSEFLSSQQTRAASTEICDNSYDYFYKRPNFLRNQCDNTDQGFSDREGFESHYEDDSQNSDNFDDFSRSRDSGSSFAERQLHPHDTLMWDQESESSLSDANIDVSTSYNQNTGR